MFMQRSNMYLVRTIYLLGEDYIAILHIISPPLPVLRQVGDRQSSPAARQNSILVPLSFCRRLSRLSLIARSSGCSSLPPTCNCHFSTGTARCWPWPKIYRLSNRPPTCRLAQHNNCGVVTPYYNHFNLQPDFDLSDIVDQLCLLLLGLSLLSVIPPSFDSLLFFRFFSPSPFPVASSPTPTTHLYPDLLSYKSL
ncbi:hypothetical protein BDV10DRAFT_56029 [Aspergillus recurvatus]